MTTFCICMLTFLFQGGIWIELDTPWIDSSSHWCCKQGNVFFKSSIQHDSQLYNSKFTSLIRNIYSSSATQNHRVYRHAPLTTIHTPYYISSNLWWLHHHSFRYNVPMCIRSATQQSRTKRLLLNNIPNICLFVFQFLEFEHELVLGTPCVDHFGGARKDFKGSQPVRSDLLLPFCVCSQLNPYFVCLLMIRTNTLIRFNGGKFNSL